MSNDNNLKENDIRPVSLMANQKVVVLKDVAMLLNERINL